MEMFNLSAATAFGVESVAKSEISRLGITVGKAVDGRVEICGGWDALARLNVNCRTAERVYIVVSSYVAATFDRLYDGVMAVEWEKFFNADSFVSVTAKSVGSKLFSLSSIQSIVKKAIVERIKTKFRRVTLNETGDEFLVEASIRNDVVTLSIDTSGVGLHKRGYRDLSVKAPIKETLAAAMILLSGWNKEKPLIDPFCGSGTIPIEAALIGNNIPPNLNRTFAFSKWECFPKDVLNSEQEKAREKIISTSLTISGFDKDAESVSISRHHAERAGVQDKIHFQVQDISLLRSSLSGGVIVTNPPYGERLNDNREILKLYQTFADVYKHLPHWNLGVITPHRSMERILGRKAIRTRKFFNANLECWYYTF